jgi:CheY-like chemotaxis protein/anti-sigma regulatory factor (Ser/Thr protein kinase)
MNTLTLSTTARSAQDRHAPPELDQVTVLVVDDNPVDRRLTGSLVVKNTACRVIHASDGFAALAAIESQKPNLVLADMLMPEMDGLELVEAVRDQYPLVPVIVMTAFGSEDIAIQALQKGAASYVPKKSLGRDIANTIQKVLAAAKVSQHQQQVLECLTKVEAQFELESDPGLVATLVAHLQEYLSRLKLCDQTARIRVGIALEEAITNAIYHGNLELSSELRQEGADAYRRQLEERRRQAPYEERRIQVEAKVSRWEAIYVIRDEGPGFDPATLPDPTDPTNLGRLSGRGLLLIRTFMDEVSYNARGNENTLTKWCDGPRQRH